MEKFLSPKANQEEDTRMKDEDIEEFCETSSWETGSYDLNEKSPKKKRSNSRNSHSSGSDNSFCTEGSDDSDISQNIWEANEEVDYKNEKRNYREYLQRKIT